MIGLDGDQTPKVIVGFACLMAGILVLALIGESAERDAFMAECLEDRKEYECTAMWRSSRPQTTFIPVVVPVR